MNQLECEQVMYNTAVPYPERLLYFYLRRNIDFETGIVGDPGKKRISYQSIREALEYSPEAGSHGVQEKFDKDRIYKLLRSLERRRIVLSLPPAPGPKMRRGSIRRLLPLAIGQIRSQEEGERRATYEGDNNSPKLQLVSVREGELPTPQEGDTSVRSTLSHTTLRQYSSYAPDDDDLKWFCFVYGDDAERLYQIDIFSETEKFNLRCQNSPEALDWSYSKHQNEWRIWICRAVDYARRRRL